MKKTILLLTLTIFSIILLFFSSNNTLESLDYTAENHFWTASLNVCPAYNCELIITPFDFNTNIPSTIRFELLLNEQKLHQGQLLYTQSDDYHFGQYKTKIPTDLGIQQNTYEIDLNILDDSNTLISKLLLKRK